MATAATKVKASPVPFKMNSNFISIWVDNSAFTLDSSHPTFDKMAKALKNKFEQLIDKECRISEGQ